jgi:sugar phosphate isomerase/epimerase
MEETRRDFIKKMGMAAVATALPFRPSSAAVATSKKDWFKISLAEWSFHNALQKGTMTNLDFPLMAKKDFGIDIVEYVSLFFDHKETDMNYLKQLKQLTIDNGITNHLIMVDGEGELGNLDQKKRSTAVENHYKWIDAAKYLGCKTIRVNAGGRGTAAAVKDALIQGLGKLTAYGQAQKINVIVENHGGYSSNAAWLASVIKGVDNKYCGTLPDFGNFRISATEKYDLYQGVTELLPYAKGISAKSHQFDANGNETEKDYERLFKIIKESSFKGIVGIEWEGSGMSESEGIKATKKLLEKVRMQLS